MLIQQYKIDCDATAVMLGAFVYHSNDEDVAIGFISATDNQSFIEVTLFDKMDEKDFPENIWDTRSEVVLDDVMDDVFPEMNERTQELWREAIIESSSTSIN